ncbi:hypothetical protein D9613_002391 [Agrocybe pediades]|uniref:Uncharacterized protein n=1 Tax=Agrocybe pediades TaxID=84607 RepID=A0A8H4VV52_9AGAR|nr:hypothetical protein D9613_002391 [Agrocybe pediades]
MQASTYMQSSRYAPYRRLRPLLPKPQPASTVHPSSTYSNPEAIVSRPVVASIHNGSSGTRGHQHRDLPTEGKSYPSNITICPCFPPSLSSSSPGQGVIKQRYHPYQRTTDGRNNNSADTQAHSLAQAATASPSIPTINSMIEEQYGFHTNPSNAASSTSANLSSSASIGTVDVPLSFSRPAFLYPAPSYVDQTSLPALYVYPNLYPVSSSLDSALGGMFDPQPKPICAKSASPSFRTQTEQLISDPPSYIRAADFKSANHEPELAGSYQGSPISLTDSPASSTSTDLLSTPPTMVSDITTAVALGDMVPGWYPSGAQELFTLLSLPNVCKTPSSSTAPMITNEEVVTNQSYPQDGLVRNLITISGQGQVLPEWSPCPRAVEPNPANNPASMCNQSGETENLASSQSEPTGKIATNASSSSTPDAGTPSQLEPPLPFEFKFLYESIYIGSRASKVWREERGELQKIISKETPPGDLKSAKKLVTEATATIQRSPGLEG